MIRRILPLLLLGAALAATLPSSARAQFFGQTGPLGVLPGDAKSCGVFLGSGRGNIDPMAELRTNYSAHGTLGIQGTVENKIFGLQADARTGLMHTDGDYPFELGGQLAAGLLTGGGQTGIYAQAVPGMSFEWDAGFGQSAAVYAGLGFRVTASNKRVGQGDGLWRLGGRLQYSNEIGMGASLEDVAGSAHLLVGADFRFGGGGNRPAVH